MTAHKHAALMLQYAHDASETDKPWERWEVASDIHTIKIWGPCLDNPQWGDDFVYRRKPNFININGFKVPAPHYGEMRLGQQYHIPDICNGRLVDTFIWSRCGTSVSWLERGLVHLTREAAEDHARALLSFTKK